MSARRACSAAEERGEGVVRSEGPRRASPPWPSPDSSGSSGTPSRTVCSRWSTSRSRWPDPWVGFSPLHGNEPARFPDSRWGNGSLTAQPRSGHDGATGSAPAPAQDLGWACDELAGCRRGHPALGGRGRSTRAPGEPAFHRPVRGRGAGRGRRPRRGRAPLFVGTVRDHDGGREVVHLAYSAHTLLARALAGRLRVAADDGVLGVAAVHRLGDLELGDVAVVVAVSTAHRGVAFAASRGSSTRSRPRCRSGSTSVSSTAARSGSAPG